LRKHTLRILCISPVFVPRADSEAFCGAKLILELVNRGNDVTVICLDPQSPQLEVCDDSELWKPLRGITVKIPTPSHKDIFYSAINGVQFQTITYARWIKAVVDMTMSLHQKNRFDLIYSRSLPMEAHIAGYWTSKLLNLPWIVNINDPWDWHLFPAEMRKECPYLYQLISSYWMRKTLRAASLVTYPSSRLRDYHIQISGVKHNSEIIPHIGYTCPSQNKTSDFCMVHAGKLGGREGRSPNALLKGLNLFLQKFPEARKSFHLIFVGPEDKNIHGMAEELGLQSIVENTGRVSYERSLEYISAATVCVLVEGKLTEGIFLPSKLVDYITARKPVLALSPKDGVVADMLPYKGILRAAVDNTEAIDAAIGYYYRAFEQGFINTCGPSEDLIQQFKPETVARQFHRKVPEILENRRS